MANNTAAQQLADSLGGPTTSNSQYDFKQTIYPVGLNLDTDPFLSIRINVLQGSSFVDSSTPTIQPNRGTASQIAGAANSTTSLVAASALGGAAAGVAAGGVAGIFTGSGIQALKAAAIGGIVAGAGTGAVGATTNGNGQANALTGKYVRLQEEIILNMPNEFSSDYSLQWEGEGAADFNMLTKIVNNNIETAKINSSSIMNLVEGFVKSNAQTGAELAGALVLKSGQNGLSAATNTAYNPKTEQLFKNVNFRQFEFSWEFSPRNQSEAVNVINIIKLLRFHAAPEYNSSNEFTFAYPSQFELRFFIGGNENWNLPKIATTVIESVNVNYTPNQIFAMMYDGSVPHIKMKVMFKEIVIHTKETIGLGY